MQNFSRCKASIIGKERAKMKKKMSWGKTLRLNNRAFKLFYQYYPQMVLSRIISVIWNALTPYVGIFLLALVIDELVGGRDIERLKMLVVITLASAAFIALGAAILNKWKETHNAGLWLKVEHIFMEKLFDMDYVNLDESRTSFHYTAESGRYRMGTTSCDCKL